MKRVCHANWQRTACRAVAMGALALVLGFAPRSAQAAPCVGDCNNSGDPVNVTGVIVMVNIALGSAQASACVNGDANSDGEITVDEIIKAVNNALGQEPCFMVGGVTPTPACGDGMVQTGEDCDEGGTCVGTAMAGTHCTSDAQCGSSGGRCNGGTKAYSACMADGDCGGGKCIKCQTFGGVPVTGMAGKTCAANCTFATDITMNLVPGQTSGTSIVAGTSGAVVYGDILTVPLPLQGSQTLQTGKASTNGDTPFSIPAASVQFPAIPVSTIACACLRGVEAKTCGGTLFDLDGITQSLDCTQNFTAGDSVCAGKNPCTFLHGAGNAGSGVIGCNGYTPVNSDFTQDSRGSLDPPECATAGTGAPICAGPPVVTLSGTGGPGSLVLLTNNAIGTVVGMCAGSSAAYGADGQFCTNDDPQSSKGTPAPLFFTTGSATGLVKNANGTDGADIGPYTVMGATKMCSELAGTVSGVSVAGSFTSINQPTLGDIVVTANLVAQ